MAPSQLVSHLVISSKWLPKIFIQLFKEYLKAKLQAPVRRPTLTLTNAISEKLAHSQKVINVAYIPNMFVKHDEQVKLICN